MNLTTVNAGLYYLGGSKFIDFDYRPKIMYNALYKQYTPEFLNFVSRF